MAENSASAASRSSTISCGDHVWRREVVGVLERLVAQPGDVQAGLVARQQLVVGERPEPLALHPLVARFRVVAGDEVVEVLAPERVLFQREVLVGAQVVDPQLLRPRRLAAPACGRRRARSPSRPARRRCRSAVAAACGRRTRAAACAGSSRRRRPRRGRCPGRRSPLGRRSSSSVLHVLQEVELLVRRRRPEVVAEDRSGPRARARLPRSRTSYDDFFPNGGFVSTMSKRSPGSPRQRVVDLDRADRVLGARCRAGAGSSRRAAQSPSTISQPVQRLELQVLASGRGSRCRSGSTM